MADTPKFASFEEFWPFYVRAHANKTSRRLHFAGTTLGGALLAAGVFTRRKSLLLAAPVVGYGLAWIGHFVFEGNKPATFGHPAWSLRGDLKMWKMMVAGTMDDEVARVLAESAPAPVEPARTVDPSLN